MFFSRLFEFPRMFLPFRAGAGLAVWAGLFTLSLTGGRAWAAERNVTEFGAVGDGVTLNTAAFHRAIEALHAEGGGVLSVPAGRFLTGTIELLSNITLNLNKDAVLLGSPRVEDYRRGNWPALVLAKDREHVGIQGEGTIDGQGTQVAADTLRIYASGDYVKFFPGLKRGEKVFTGIGTDKDPWIDPYAMQEAGTLANRVAPRDREDVATWRVDEFVRPQLIEFWHCRGVSVSGITLRNAANWVQTYRECDDVTLRGLQVKSVTYWNNDGIDIVNCRRVLIEDCDVNAADDAICLKSDPSETGRLCEDVTIRSCRIRSSASAVKLGTASHHGFRKIRIERIDVFDTYRSAIALETVDGGVLEDITISKVRARNTGNAIFLRIGQRNPAKAPGKLRNIEISDVEVHIPRGKPDLGYPHEGPAVTVPTNLIPSSITGLAEQWVENVTLRDITLIYAGGADRKTAEVPLDKLSSVPEKRKNYPEFSMFGELPAWGLYLRNVRGLRCERMMLKVEQADFRPAIVADGAAEVSVTRLRIEGPASTPPIYLSNVTEDSWKDATRSGEPAAIKRAQP